MEYNLRFHTTWLRMDPYGKLKKMVAAKCAHGPSVEDLWANWKDENEVRIRHYMRMTVYFVKMVNLFPVLD